MKEIIFIGLALFSTFVIGLVGLSTVVFGGALLFSPLFTKFDKSDAFNKKEKTEYHFFRIVLGITLILIGILAIFFAGKICFGIAMPLLRDL